MDCPVEPTRRDATDPLDGAVWHKSSYSGTHGNCVEVAVNLPGLVAVRDSKDPAGTVLVVSSAEWRGIVRELKGVTVG
jgi:hypothetical protein